MKPTEESGCASICLTNVLYLDKENIIKIIINDSPHYALITHCNMKYVEETSNTKFLHLQINIHLHWKNHIDYVICGTCDALRSTFQIIKTETLKTTWFTYFAL